MLFAYEKASGQCINFKKLSVSFSENVEDNYKQLISEFLQVSTTVSTERCLGMCMTVGRSKIASFDFIRERIWKRINSWRANRLNWGGREVLIFYNLSRPILCLYSEFLPACVRLYIKC